MRWLQGSSAAKAGGLLRLLLLWRCAMPPGSNRSRLLFGPARRNSEGLMKTSHPIVDIELLFLDLNTCARCQGTYANLDAAVDQVRRELEAQGLTVRLQRRHVTSEAEALALGFEISQIGRASCRERV